MGETRGALVYAGFFLRNYRLYATIEKLDEEIQQLVKERNQDKAKIKWQLTKEKARIKLNRHYNKVNDKNILIEK